MTKCAAVFVMRSYVNEFACYVKVKTLTASLQSSHRMRSVKGMSHTEREKRRRNIMSHWVCCEEEAISKIPSNKTCSNDYCYYYCCCCCKYWCCCFFFFVVHSYIFCLHLRSVPIANSEKQILIENEPSFVYTNWFAISRWISSLLSKRIHICGPFSTHNSSLVFFSYISFIFWPFYCCYYESWRMFTWNRLQRKKEYI